MNGKQLVKPEAHPLLSIHMRSEENRCKIQTKKVNTLVSDLYLISTETKSSGIGKGVRVEKQFQNIFIL